EVAQGLIEAGLLVRTLFALADDQRARNLVFPRRKLLRPHAGDHDAARGHATAQLLRLGSRNVDDWCGRRHGDSCPDPGLVLYERAFDDDRTRADEAPVFDDHGARAGRFEHAADADAAGQVAIFTDLGARA